MTLFSCLHTHYPITDHKAAGVKSFLQASTHTDLKPARFKLLSFRWKAPVTDKDAPDYTLLGSFSFSWIIATLQTFPCPTFIITSKCYERDCWPCHDRPFLAAWRCGIILGNVCLAWERTLTRFLEVINSIMTFFVHRDMCNQAQHLRLDVRARHWVCAEPNPNKLISCFFRDTICASIPLQILKIPDLCAISLLIKIPMIPAAAP